MALSGIFSRRVLFGGFLLVFSGILFFGIPSAFAATIIPYGTSISGHETWTAANSPYIVSNAYVSSGASLTIEPGTIVKGVNNLGVQGTLTVGTLGASKVVFTSWADDDAGGDTNNDGNGSTPNEKGDWGGINISGSGTATITDTVFKYGGQAASYVVSSTGTGAVLVSHSEFVYGNNAILIGGGTADVYDNSFHDLGQYAIHQTKGILRFGRNAFENIKKRTISLEGGTTQSDGGNIGDVVVYFTNHTINDNAVIPNDGFTYHVSGVTIASGASLTIEPGAIVKAAGNWPIISHGTLNIGSSEEGAEQTIITSAYDDSVGAIESSTDKDPSMTGDWGGIAVEYDGTATIVNTKIKYGGFVNYGALYIFSGQLSVSHTEFFYGNNGMLLAGGTTDVYDNTFHDIGQFDVWQTNGEFHFGGNAFSAIRKNLVYVTGGFFQNDGGNSGAGGIFIQNSVLSGDMILSKDDVPYILSSVDVPEGRSLAIAPGAIVKMMGGSTGWTLRSAGTLNIGSSDTNADPVIITSYYDDTVGGDIDGENPVHAPMYDDWAGIIISGGMATVSNANISYGGGFYGAQLYSEGGTVTVMRTHFQKGSTGVYMSGGTLTLSDSELSDGKSGLKYYAGTVMMSGNSIHSNSEYGVLNVSPTQTVIDATNNWWGSPTGPNNLLANPNGVGDRVSDYVLFDPWLTYDPIARFQLCGDHCYSSVLFLPGIMGSRLYWREESCSLINCENKLWVSNRSADGEKLYMDEGVSKIAGIYAKDGDIVSTVGPTNSRFYQSFAEDMNALMGPTKPMAAWKPIAYDWRYDYESLLKNGYVDDGKIYYDDTDNSPYIISEFLKLAEGSNTGKVTIVAHSNGGLIAKALTKKLESMGKGDLVDKMVLVASPQVGTPQAIGALLHGYNPSSEINFLINAEVQRELSHGMPMSYNLLPAKEYFDTVRKPVAEFDASLERQRNAFGDTVDSYQEEYDFLLGAEGRQKPDSYDLKDPAIVDRGLLDHAEDWHDNFDHWTPPTSVKLYQIAGWGIDTVRGIGYGEAPWYSSALMSYQPIMTEDGDGTVVTPSALYDDAGERYYVDLNKYKMHNPKQSHADILEIPELRTFVEDIIADNNITTLPTYISQSRPSIIDVKKRLRYYLHSPLTLEMYDTDGHHVGYSSETGDVDMDIPGATYNEFGEVKYISVPEDIATKLVMRGQDTGRFVLNVEEVEGEVITGQTTFANIEVSPDTIVTMDTPMNTGPSELPGLSIDQDGDGDSENILPPGTIVDNRDMIAPVTTLSLSDTEGQNGWYTSDVIVTLSAMDEENGSGVDKIEYFLDDVTTWNTYTDPIAISQEGVSMIKYRATDKAGNQEEAKVETIKIDKTKPTITGTALPVANERGWNSTDVTVSFSCKDSLSGIETDTIVGATLVTEGKDQSVANMGECIDQAGNHADSATMSGINIDKTAPEVKISFNKDTRKLDVIGVDNFSPVSSSETVKTIGTKIMRTVSLVDQAGHTTKFILSHPNVSLSKSIIETVESIAYDGTVMPLSDTHLLYAWLYSEKTKKYSAFASTLNAGQAFVDALFSPALNMTILLERAPSGSLSLRYKSGMAVSYMETDKGKIRVKY